MWGTWDRWLVAVVAGGLCSAACSAPDDGSDDAVDGTESTQTPASAGDDGVDGDGGPLTSTGAPGTSAASGEASGTPDDDAAGSSEGSDGGSTEGESGVVRFIALGDSGEGNEAQHLVANAAEVVCQDLGCDFALLLGDNFYDEGVTSVDDPQFATKFENVYSGLDFPFYIVLGNHDYGALASDWERGQYQIDYGLVNPKWVMPHFWYTFSSESGDTQFFALDTQRMMFDHQTDVQAQWLDEQFAASSAAWKVVFAHHPYLSNGSHGNAGNYEGIGLPLIAGQVIKDFFDERVCGVADVYFSGHDHNRQAFDPVCGTYFIVSGAAAKTSDFEFRDDNPTAWGDDQREGFVWVEIAGNDFTARFYDLDGNMDYEQTFTRG